MTVRKRGGIYHMDIVVRRGDKTLRVKKTTGTKSKHEAVAIEAKERAKLLAKAHVVGKSPFFFDFADEFLDSYAAANNKPSEIDSKKMIVKRHLKPAFGHLRLDEVEGELIEKYKAAKLVGGEAEDGTVVKPLKPKSVNNHLIVLNTMLAIAEEWKRLDRKPKIKLLTVGEHDYDFFTFEESERLIAAAEPVWRTMILMVLRAGLRINELLALQWDDVDLKARQVVVRRGSWKKTVGTPKGGKPKPIPLSGELVAELTVLPSRFAGGLVFPSSKGKGKMFSREMCHRPLRRACKVAGLREVGWHVLRHTFGSHLAIRGVPIKTIQELMRHASIQMTMRYAHLTPDVRQDAVDLLDHPKGAPAAPAEKASK